MTDKRGLYRAARIEKHEFARADGTMKAIRIKYHYELTCIVMVSIKESCLMLIKYKCIVHTVLAVSLQGG